MNGFLDSLSRWIKSRTRTQSAEPKNYQPRLENLEDRLVLSGNVVMSSSSSVLVQNPIASGIYYNSLTQEVNIYGTNGADKTEVSQSSFSPDINTPAIVMTQVTLNNQTKLFLGGIAKVNFWGYNGNDEFRNYSSVPSNAHGGAGNDLMIGGPGQDQLFGDADNDRLFGGANSDGLFGGTGNDALYPGAGTDSADGGDNDDTIVCIGGGIDTVAGGLGKDSFWTDTTDVILDASNWEIANGHVHAVAQFMSYKIDGGAIAVGKELNGPSLADPLHMVVEVEEGVMPPVFSMQNYADKPLFAAAGPTKDDIFQGKVGDCYFVATLSAIADANPDYIRQMVVDLGDGTYAVRFYKAGQEVYVRVDADFCLQDGTLAYAKLGQESSLWGPVVEKAYAFFRRGKGTYESIAGGDGTLPEHLNLTRATFEIQDGVTAQEVVDWYAAGSPAGTLADKIHTGVIELLNWIKDQLAAGKAITTGARSTVSNNIAIQLDDPATTDANESTYRRGQHVYMVDSILCDANGNPTTLRLRNPYGSYLNLTNFTRIYFCVGRATAWDVEEKSGMVIYNPDFMFEEQVVGPLPGPWSSTDLARSATIMAAVRSVALETYQGPTLASDPMLQSLARTATPIALSPLQGKKGLILEAESIF